MTARVRSANPWALPLGQLILPAGAPREEWLNERRKGLGSSDAPLLMGLPQGDDSEYGMWLDKTGRVAHQPPNEAMQRGIWLEPHVVDWFATRTGLEVRRCGMVAHREVPWLRANPDRLTEDGGLVEIKTLNSWAKTKVEWRDGIARHAYVQAQWQLMVTGRSCAWFCAYAIDQEPMVRGPVPPDEPLIERMRLRAERWWETHIVKDEPPPVDLATITDTEIELRWPTAEAGSSVEAPYPSYVREMLSERAEVKAAEKLAGERAKEIDRALRVLAGSAEALLIGDRPVVTFKKQDNPPRVLPALETDYPEIWEQYIRRGTHRRIHVLKGWENA
jgi:putative phage-type endonuclease